MDRPDSVGGFIGCVFVIMMVGAYVALVIGVTVGMTSCITR